jgi:hypothetical protein
VQKKDFVTNPLEFFKKKPFKTVSSDPDRDFELRNSGAPKVSPPAGGRHLHGPRPRHLPAQSGDRSRRIILTLDGVRGRSRRLVVL